MSSRSLIAAAAFAVGLAGTMSANSQPIPLGPGSRRPPPAAVALNREAELIGLHQLCDRGDRQACIRFGFVLGQAQEHHAEWRRSHADWWGWDRH